MGGSLRLKMVCSDRLFKACQDGTMFQSKISVSREASRLGKPLEPDLDTAWSCCFSGIHCSKCLSHIMP